MIDTNKHAAIILHTHGTLKGHLEIRNARLCYTYDVINGMSGMQCEYVGGTKEYDEVMKECERMRDAYLSFLQGDGQRILTDNKIW